MGEELTPQSQGGSRVAKENEESEESEGNKRKSTFAAAAPFFEELEFLMRLY